MRDLAVNGMNAISAVADILILLGLFCGAIYLVIDTYIIIEAVKNRAFFAFRLAIVAVVTSPLIIIPLLFTVYAIYALNHTEKQRKKKKNGNSDDVFDDIYGYNRNYMTLKRQINDLRESIEDMRYQETKDIEALQNKIDGKIEMEMPDIGEDDYNEEESEDEDDDFIDDTESLYISAEQAKELYGKNNSKKA